MPDPESAGPFGVKDPVAQSTAARVAKRDMWAAFPSTFPRQVKAKQRCSFKSHGCLDRPQGSCPRHSPGIWFLFTTRKCGYYRAWWPSSSFSRVCVEEPRAWEGGAAEQKDQHPPWGPTPPRAPSPGQVREEPIRTLGPFLAETSGTYLLQSWEGKEQGSSGSK